MARALRDGARGQAATRGACSCPAPRSRSPPTGGTTCTGKAARCSPPPCCPTGRWWSAPTGPSPSCPGQSTLFFLELPVWFRLSTTGRRPARIFEEPLSTLTRTWFGDPVTGELCWGLATRLHHSIDSVEPSAWIAVCPLLIENDSETDLDFEKICLHVENLSIFRGPKRLWANSLNVIFKGPDQATQIEIVHSPPGSSRGWCWSPRRASPRRAGTSARPSGC